MGVSRREKKHSEIESIIGLGELDRLTEAAYDSAMAGISVDRIASLPKDPALDVVASTATDGLRDGYIRHAGYVKRNRRFFSRWMMMEGEELKLQAIIDRILDGDDE